MSNSDDVIPKDEISEDIPDDEAARMSFTGHLGELRTRMIHTTIALATLFFLGLGFSNHTMTYIYDLVNVNLSTEELQWVTLTPLEPFMVRIKIALYTAIALGTPYIVYQICGFVFPGLKTKERYVVKFALFASSGLALFGIATALFIVFPFVFPQLLKFAPQWVHSQLQLADTMTFIFKVVLGFGLAFQFPVIILISVYLDLLTPKTLKEQRKVAIVVIMVVAAILTPPDPATLLLMSAPLLVLYEISILMSHLVVRRRNEKESS